MAVIGIIAIAKNLAIGKDGRLPWHYSSDLKYFKRTTLHNAVVMGSTTWKGLRRPLPKRLNLVLSRKQPEKMTPGVLYFNSVDAVLALNEYLNCDLFVIGGEKTYSTFAEHITRWIVSEIPFEAPDADTYMPADFLDDFETLITEEGEEGIIVKTYGRR